MKEEQQRRYPVLASRLFRAVAYIFLVFLSYAFGFYSGISLKPPINFVGDSKNSTTEKLSNSDPVRDSGHFRFGGPCADAVTSKLVRQTVLDHIFNGTSPFTDFPPPHLRSLLQQRRIKGWGSTGAVFENLIRRIKPRTIIEIGTFLGASAIHMGQVAQELGLRTQILCIDDFRGWPEFNKKVRHIHSINGDVMLLHQFMQNVNYMNMTERITPIPFSSSSALIKLCEWGVLADLIEIDAGHDFHSVWSDINMAYKILRPGGIIFGHDYFTMTDDRGVRRAVNLFAKAKGLQVEVDGQHWVIDST